MADILLVDDNAQLLKLLNQLLTNFGHQVSQAANGNAALKLAQKQRFDLIITDIVMPDGDGLETIPALRRQFPEVKILAISGGGYQSPRDYLKMGTQLGANLALAKPFSPEQLRAAVDSLLAQT